MPQNESLPTAEELRGRERSDEHLGDVNALIHVTGVDYEVELIDESISGVGVVFHGAAPVLELDQCVEVSRGEYRRDAIIQRVWTDTHRRLRLGLQWRASHFVR